MQRMDCCSTCRISTGIFNTAQLMSNFVRCVQNMLEDFWLHTKEGWLRTTWEKVELWGLKEKAVVISCIVSATVINQNIKVMYKISSSPSPPPSPSPLPLPHLHHTASSSLLFSLLLPLHGSEAPPPAHPYTRMCTHNLPMLSNAGPSLQVLCAMWGHVCFHCGISPRKRWAGAVTHSCACRQLCCRDWGSKGWRSLVWGVGACILAHMGVEEQALVLPTLWHGWKLFNKSLSKLSIMYTISIVVLNSTAAVRFWNHGNQVLTKTKLMVLVLVPQNSARTGPNQTVAALVLNSTNSARTQLNE